MGAAADGDPWVIFGIIGLGVFVFSEWYPGSVIALMRFLRVLRPPPPPPPPKPKRATRKPRKAPEPEPAKETKKVSRFDLMDRDD